MSNPLFQELFSEIVGPVGCVTECVLLDSSTSCSESSVASSYGNFDNSNNEITIKAN